MKSGAGRGATGRMEQEKRQKMLAEYCKTRDVGLRNELVTEYMYLADMVARKYAGRGVEYDDLKQIAAMALIGALERFSCDKGIQFSTFAVPSMTGVVKNYFRDRSRIIRMPRTIGERVQKITLAREALTQELMRAPTPREIAERCGYSEADVLEATEAMQSLSLTSLDAQVGEEEDTPLASMLGQEEAEFENIALRDLLQKVMDKLSDAERKILHMRYFEERPQRDIAPEMGVSQMYVSRVERKMLARFREALREA